ncbi:MAG: AsmA-like C-terminal domain-containing protein, partial [Pseudomonadota bacterium]|nr:AsmA-like C-terminal domain-containing protein [Pseudomonadota bacterium]
SLVDGSARIDRFDLIAGDMEAIGKLDFEGGNFRRWKADFSKFKVGKTDIRGQVSKLSDGEFLVRLDGSRLDIEQLLIGDQREGREVTRNALTETKQIYIDMNVDSLRTGPGFGLGRTEGQMRLIGREVDMLSLDAGLGDGKSLQINYAPSEAGHALEIRSNDAGATLRMLGWSDKLEGGELSVTGQRRGQDEPLSGSFKLSDYKLTKAPALARLLQVASLTGIFDALQSGLEFVAFDGAFAYSNKLLRVERSRAYGSSIGITVEGALDLEEDIAELKGTVVPAYTVNRVLGQIPILGPILTGGENEGVFAASYAVNGPLEDPAIAVNPLSALAPGFLRKLFDAIGGDTEPSPSAAPEKQDN